MSSSIFQEIMVNTHERLTLPDKFVGLPELSSQYKARVSTGLVQRVQLYKLGAHTNHVIHLQAPHAAKQSEHGGPQYLSGEETLARISEYGSICKLNLLYNISLHFVWKPFKFTLCNFFYTEENSTITICLVYFNHWTTGGGIFKKLFFSIINISSKYSCHQIFAVSFCMWISCVKCSIHILNAKYVVSLFSFQNDCANLQFLSCLRLLAYLHSHQSEFLNNF